MVKVQFYLDLNLSGTSVATPGVPSLDVDDTLTALPVIASTTCSASAIKKLITFTTNNDPSYNWADGTNTHDFSDFTFTATTTQSEIDAAQDSIFSATDNWLDKFNSLEHNQYANGSSSTTGTLQTDGSYNSASTTLHDTAGSAIGTIPKDSPTLPTTQASASRFIANAIAASVFNANLSYDIFDNEKVIFEQCMAALEDMAGNIADGFINGTGHMNESSQQDDSVADLSRATYVGRELIGRILAENNGPDETTVGGDPNRFVNFGDTTAPKEIPLEVDDEIYIKCSSLTVDFNNPISTGNENITITTCPDFLVLLKLVA